MKGQEDCLADQRCVKAFPCLDLGGVRGPNQQSKFFYVNQNPSPEYEWKDSRNLNYCYDIERQGEKFHLNLVQTRQTSGHLAEVNAQGL